MSSSTLPCAYDEWYWSNFKLPVLRFDMVGSSLDYRPCLALEVVQAKERNIYFMSHILECRASQRALVREGNIRV